MSDSKDARKGRSGNQPCRNRHVPGTYPERGRRQPARVGTRGRPVSGSPYIRKAGGRRLPVGRPGPGVRIQARTYSIWGQHRGRPTAYRRLAWGQPGRGFFRPMPDTGETGAGRPGKSRNGGRNRGRNTGAGALEKGRSGGRNTGMPGLRGRRGRPLSGRLYMGLFPAFPD